MTQKRTSNASIFLIIAFLILIFAPFSALILSDKSELSLGEMRTLSPFPTLKFTPNALRELPSQFEAYFNDHFGFRENFIYWNNYIKAKYFGVSPVKKVVIGKDGWLFFAGNTLIDDFRGIHELSRIQLEGWKDDLERKQRWLAKRNIKYLFFVAPNKQSVYPEYMPSYLNQIGKRTQLDQLTEYLQQKSTVQILDVRERFLQKKKSLLIYQKTDTHWTEKGAYIAYEAIMEKLEQWFPEMKTLPLSAFAEKKIFRSKGGELSKMLNLEDTFPEDETLVFKLKSSCAQNVAAFAPPPDISSFKKMRLPIAHSCKKKPLRALILRDSFFTSLLPLVSEHFAETMYIWRFRPLIGDEWDFKYWTTLNTPLQQIIEAFQPNVIIEESVERELFMDLPPEQYLVARGLTLLSNGRQGEAKNNFEEALKIAPDSIDAKLALLKAM